MFGHRALGGAQVSPSSRASTRIASLALGLLRRGGLLLRFRRGRLLLLGLLPDADLRRGRRGAGAGAGGSVARGKTKGGTGGGGGAERGRREKPHRDAVATRRGVDARAREARVGARSRHGTQRRETRRSRRGAGLGGGRTSCSMCPMSSSISDCLRSGWNASPLGPRARAMGAQDPSSFHRAIGRR